MKFSELTKCAVAVFGATLFAVGFSACDSTGSYGATLLGKAATATSLTYQERTTQNFTEISQSAEDFAAKFASSVYAADNDVTKNIAVSPVSVYIALSLAAQCADGDTRTQLLDALNISYENLTAQFPYLYRSLVYESSDSKGKEESVCNLTNSIWIDNSATAKEDCITTLSDNFYCNSYQVDFLNDNAAANKSVRKFVKDKTRNLIDQDFGFDVDTMFVLMNILYLKDIWNEYGDDLGFTSDEYSFTCADGEVSSLNLLSGYYTSGRAYSTESYSTFYTTTENGYKIKFIVPQDGYSVSDVFTEENIGYVNSINDYNAVDDENKLIYETRCLFPEFTSSYDGDITNILQSYGITDFFTNRCNMTTLTDDSICCSLVKHITKLEVNKKGIEGAAVTYITMDTAAGYQDEYQIVYEDFVVDRSFGFILTDKYNTTLFSGVVNAV